MLTFKVLDLLADNEFMTKQDIEDCHMQGWKKDTGGTFYSFTAKFEKDYLFIYCEFDNKQYRETVYDMEHDVEAENPRKPYQNELRQQFFACYDTKNSTLYLSDFQKKSILQSYLHEQTNKDIKIRERFNSIDGFCEMVKFIKSISFIQHNSLMNAHGTSVFHQMYSPLGLDIPDKVTTKIEYGNSPIGQLRRAINNIKAKKENCEFDSIVIVGTDAIGAEVRFSYETLVSNKTINIVRNENGRYDSEDVFTTLIAEIEAQHV